ARLGPETLLKSAPETRQRAQKQRQENGSNDEAEHLRTRLGCGWAAGVRRAQAVERTLGGVGFGRARRDLDQLIPRFFSGGEILLAESSNDTKVQQSLRVLRVNLQRMRELLDRFVRLVDVVVADAQVRADVDVVRIQLERVAVPLDGVVVVLGIEVEVRQF